MSKFILDRSMPRTGKPAVRHVAAVERASPCWGRSRLASSDERGRAANRAECEYRLTAARDPCRRGTRGARPRDRPVQARGCGCSSSVTRRSAGATCASSPARTEGARRRDGRDSDAVGTGRDETRSRSTSCRARDPSAASPSWAGPRWAMRPPPARSCSRSVMGRARFHRCVPTRVGTIVDSDALAREVDEVRARGFAEATGEREDDLNRDRGTDPRLARRARSDPRPAGTARPIRRAPDDSRSAVAARAGGGNLHRAGLDGATDSTPRR